MTRSVPEWVADHDDQAIPPRVKLRIWEREGGKCYLTGRKIRPSEPFQYDHVIALCNGGRHAENNIRLALSEPHRAKTDDDLAIKSKITRQRQKHLGVYPKSKARLASRGFQKSRPGVGG